MRYRRSCLGVASVTGLAAALLLTSTALGAEAKPPQKPSPKEAPARPEHPRADRATFPPGMPPHPGLPNVLKALQEAARAVASNDLGRSAVDVAVDLLSGNAPKLLSELAAQLLSGNRAKLLSEISPALLSGNETELLSGNELEVFNGNRISILSNIKIEIHITESGNHNGNHTPPPPNKQPPKKEPVKKHVPERRR